MNSSNEMPEDTLCFVKTISTFYFPVREMTDNELLQFIDFYYKRDYSVLEAFTEKITDNIIVDDEVSEKGVVQTAKQFLMDVYGINMEDSDYSIELVHYNTEVIDDIYQIEVPRLGGMYTVFIDAGSGLLKSIKSVDTFVNLSEILVDESVYIKNYTDVKAVISKIAQQESINKTHLQYMYNENILYFGQVKYYFELGNKAGYLIIYDCNSQSIQSITYVEDYSTFQQNMQSDLEHCEIHNLTQKIVDLE